MKDTICTAIGIIGGVIASLFGGWDTALQTLVIFMAIDYITGLVVAGVFHASPKTKTGALESKAGWKGLIRKGETLGLVGESGCGKSTLLKILLGWLPGYQGKVLYDERDVRDYTPEQLQQKMSYIEQNVFLFNTTIRENITLGEHFTDEQMEKALRDSALAGDLANMPKGLDTPVGEEGNALSGGQKQRVAIARALIHNRSILLVDEGTSALDQKNADIVEKSLLSNPDLTLILISHHLSDERKAQFDHVYELTPASSIV